MLTRTEDARLLTLLRQEDRDKIPPILYPLKLPYRKKIIHGGRGSAKTRTAVSLTGREASIRRLRVVFAREIFDSIEDSIYDEILIWIQSCGYPGWKIFKTRFENTITGSKFVFKGLRDLRATRAMKGLARYDRIVVDEAEGVLMESWDMLVPTFRESNSEIWAIFNRYEDLDPVYEKFCLVPDPDTLVIECNWRDNPFFPEILRKEMLIDKKTDYNKYLHIWENHPIAQLEEAVMSRALVNEAMKRTVAPDGPQVIGVDVARYGDDSTRAYERRGMCFKKLLQRKHEAPIITARAIADMADNKATLINIDNGGLGAGGMIDELRDLGYVNVIGINFGGTAKDDKEYGNVVSEMYFEVKDLLKDADIPEDRYLRQDLTGRLYKYDRKIRKIVEPKPDFKKRYKRSPDDGDALLLTGYNPGSVLVLSEDSRERQKEIVTRNRNKRRQWKGWN